MKIDSMTGSVALEGTDLLGPDLRKEIFLASPLGQRSRRGTVNEQWVSYLVSVKDGSDEFALTAVFSGGWIAEIRLAKTDAAKSWADWSEEMELQRKAEHDRLLNAMLGRVSGRFPWGEVVSVFDSRSGASEIIIRYKDAR